MPEIYVSPYFQGDFTGIKSIRNSPYFRIIINSLFFSFRDIIQLTEGWVEVNPKNRLPKYRDIIVLI